MFSRISLPIQNVFSATGGNKDYANGESKFSAQNVAKLISTVSDIRDGKSLQLYLESQWVNLYHTDPAGVLWIRYSVEDDLEVYPTYQCISAIRNYEADGQCVEYILFEPTILQDGTQVWILVDDSKQYTINQKGDIFNIDSDPLKTFNHPFGSVPVIINSDITDKYGNRLSPFDTILPASKEYARDLSIRTIYKMLQGFPKHWKREMVCADCHGTRKDGSGDGECKSCSPQGNTAKSDVTDVAILPMSLEGENNIKGDDVMGYESPDLETLKQQNVDIDDQENKIYETLWGVAPMRQIVKTATEIHYDMQPQIQRLHKYANVVEWIEWKITEWCANVIDTSKDKNESVSLIVYGRRYVLEGIDTIQEKYEKAKASGDNSIILDGIFDELITVKFKNDPECLKRELDKAKIEPYLHYSSDQIFNYFGAKEASRKMYFTSWWKTLNKPDLISEINLLKTKFDSDFETYYKSLNIQPINPITNPLLP